MCFVSHAVLPSLWTTGHAAARCAAVPETICEAVVPWLHAVVADGGSTVAWGKSGEPEGGGLG